MDTAKLADIADRLAVHIQASGFRASVSRAEGAHRVCVFHPSRRARRSFGYVEVTGAGLLDCLTASGRDGEILAEALAHFGPDGLMLSAEEQAVAGRLAALSPERRALVLVQSLYLLS